MASLIHESEPGSIAVAETRNERSFPQASANTPGGGLRPAVPNGQTRVAILVPEALPGQGGIARVIAYQTRYLAEHCPDIAFRVFRSRYGRHPVLRHLSTPFALVAFAANLIGRRIDVVHINVAPRGSTWRKMAFAAAARLLGRKVIVHLHGSGYNEFYAGRSPRQQAVIRSFFHRADKVVALSGFWKRFLASELGVPESKIVTIPNGVPAARGPRLVRPPSTRPPVILFLGAVGYRKGIDVLIDAFTELRRRNVGFSAVIGGNGEVAETQARARECSLADQIAFPGWVDEQGVSQLLADADIFVLPSRAENQPVSILEAMARAIPVVSTTVGAIPEQVIDGETGFLVPRGEPMPLADALQKLIEAPELRLIMGHAGLRRFEARFSLAASAESFAALYRGLGASGQPVSR